VLSPSASIRGESRELPVLRILNPRETEEHARNRQAWGDIWCAIAREADADRLDEPCEGDNETTA
jgi:hypothetical protein